MFWTINIGRAAGRRSGPSEPGLGLESARIRHRTTHSGRQLLTESARAEMQSANAAANTGPR